MPPVANTLHAGGGGEGDRRAHGGRPELPALGDGDGEVALGRLASGAEDPLVLGRLEPDTGHTVEHGGDRRDRAGLTHRGDTAVERLGVRR